MAEQESRDPVSRVMNAAWPEYGGNHQTIEFWNDFGEGVQFTLKHQASTNGWQPIETAPEDGEFLAEDKYGDWLRVVRFRTTLVNENAVINQRRGVWWTATRWMPLPAPPDVALDGRRRTT